MNTEEFDLTRLVRGEKRDWDAFATFAAPRISAAVRHTAPGLDAGEVADRVQDVFLRLCKDDFHLLKTYDPGRARVTTWLSLVARSVTLDHLRRKRLPTQGLDAIPTEPEAPRSPDLSPLPLPEGLLSDRQILVLRLLYERDLSVVEAAAILGVEPQTLRSTKHKALSRLRRHRGEILGGR